MASEYANHWSPTLKLSVLCTKSSIGVKSVTRPSTTWARPDARTSCSRANSRYVSTKQKIVKRTAMLETRCGTARRKGVITTPGLGGTVRTTSTATMAKTSTTVGNHHALYPTELMSKTTS